MTCTSCQAAEADPLTGRYRANCIECQARALAHGPLVFASVRAGVKSPEYAAALRKVFGEGNERQGHEKVREWFKRIQRAKGNP